MIELIFCLAIFLRSFKVDSVVYRMLVNKRVIVQFLRMIVSQLNYIKRNLLDIETKLKDIVQDHDQSLEVLKRDAIIESISEELETMAVPNKSYVVDQFCEKMAAVIYKTDTRLNQACENDLIVDFLKQIKKSNKRWAQQKIDEINYLKQESKDRLIALVKSRIPCTTHPANVADRLIKLMKGKTSVAQIVADESFSMEHLMSKQDRRTVRRIFKCYNKTKQYYSLTKIYGSLSQMGELNHKNGAVFVSCIKRALTVLGETMKNTKSTPNMPHGRIRNTIEKLLMPQLSTFNISHRNTYAKAFSLKRLLIADNLEENILINLPYYMTVVRVMLLLLIAVLGADIRRSFYGLLYECNTVQALRLLLLYVENNDDLAKMLKECLKEVKNYFDNIEKLLKEFEHSPVGQKAQFKHAEQHFTQQYAFNEELRTMVETEETISNLRKTCFACTDIITIRRLLRWKLESYHPNRLLQRMAKEWDTSTTEINSMVNLDTRLVTINIATVPNKLKMIQMAMDSAHYYGCIEHTRQLAKQIGVDATDDSKHQTLNTKLRSYYDNMFFLDNKWKSLNEFCKQNHILLPSDKVHSLREEDEARLQQLFEERQNRLRTILEIGNIREVEDIASCIKTISPCIIAALEYIQLEVCEILTTVGYFGDNFYYLKHRIPMIMGKSYRNLLAHDALSYDILSDSGEEKLLINAFVLANTKITLFPTANNKPQCSNTMELSFPTPEDIFRWVAKQEKLLEVLKSDDSQLLQVMMQAGGEIKSHFYYALQPDQHQPCYVDLTKVVHRFCRPNSPVIQLLGRYFPSFAKTYHHPEIMLQNALERSDFHQVVDLYCSLPEMEFDKRVFSWPMLLSKFSSDFIARLPLQCKQDYLNLFLDYGNESCAREMISNYIQIPSQHTVSHAMIRGMYSVVELLVQNTSRLQTNDMEQAIIMHWNDLLPAIAVKTELDAQEYVTLLETAVKVHNEKAVKYLLQDTLKRTAKALKVCIITAALHGRNNILKYLLSHFFTPVSITLLEALREAAATKHWITTRLLFEAVGSEKLESACDARMTDILLGFVTLGQSRLIRKIVSLYKFNYKIIKYHPLALAVEYVKASPRMIATLRLLGFGWLDCTTILHEIILQGSDQPSWNAIWSDIDDQLSKTFTLNSDHCTLVINVLQRWKTIAFVEQIKSSNTSLCCAIQSNDKSILRTLLSRSHDMRNLNDSGILQGIVFQIGSSIVRLDTEHEQWDVRTCCDKMINRMTHLFASSNEMCWQEFTSVCGEVVVHLSVFPSEEISQPIEVEFKIRVQEFKNNTRLIDNLQDVQTIANEIFNKHTAVHATFTKGNRTVHFWRLEDLSSAYDIYPPDSAIDLSPLVNIPALFGKTVLHCAALKETDVETLKLLMENGAHPLLKDKFGKTPIHHALQNPMKPELALCLMKECVVRCLCSVEGSSLTEVTDGDGKNKLIHTATIWGHEDAILYLIRNNADVTARNVHLQTPAHIVAVKPMYNSVALMKILLNQDRGLLNLVDSYGCTPLGWAAKVGNIKLLHTIMEYRPDFDNTSANRDALKYALMAHHAQWVKCFIELLTANGIQGITKLFDMDLIMLSLDVDDWQLSVVLLEYELGHTLTKQPTRGDLDRFNTIIQSAGDLTTKHESKRFIMLLKCLIPIRPTTP
ncbi:uncharacterized protein LOC121594189 isoform X2 [Anopheles merus]|nr:uncharacterized protein LOC121594189 isoform X2 [Anopheles merus]